MRTNHGVDLYPGWSNTSDFAPTAETFDFVPLQPSTLTEQVNAIKLSKEVLSKLTPDERYMAEASGTQLPFTPIVTVKEKSLFQSLALR